MYKCKSHDTLRYAKLRQATLPQATLAWQARHYCASQALQTVQSQRSLFMIVSG